MRTGENFSQAPDQSHAAFCPLDSYGWSLAGMLAVARFEW